MSSPWSTICYPSVSFFFFFLFSLSRLISLSIYHLFSHFRLIFSSLSRNGPNTILHSNYLIRSGEKPTLRLFLSQHPTLLLPVFFVPTYPLSPFLTPSFPPIPSDPDAVSHWPHSTSRAAHFLPSSALNFLLFGVDEFLFVSRDGLEDERAEWTGCVFGERLGVFRWVGVTVTTLLFFLRTYDS